MNTSLRLVEISGAHAAGKDTHMLEILKEFPDLVRAIPWTTRSPRIGEEHGVTYYFINEEERLKLFEANELVNHVEIRGHHSGLRRNELLRSERMILDIIPDGARRVKRVVEEMDGRAFLIYLHAPEHERRHRIRLRQPGILDDDIDRMIVGDPVCSDPGEHTDFDLVVSNGDGEFGTASQRIIDAIRNFLIF